VVYLDINLAKVAMWLYGYLSGYIDIEIISPTYLDIDMRARISVDIDIRRSVLNNALSSLARGAKPFKSNWRLFRLPQLAGRFA
jgi:hypothetical protein